MLDNFVKSSYNYYVIYAEANRSAFWLKSNAWTNPLTLESYTADEMTSGLYREHHTVYTDKDGNEMLAGSEIDLIELIDNEYSGVSEADGFTSNLHVWANRPTNGTTDTQYHVQLNEEYRKSVDMTEFDNDYHTYGFLISAEQKVIKCYIDGIWQYDMSIDPEIVESQGLANGAESLLNCISPTLSTGINLDKAKAQSEDLQNEFIVDYVKLYQPENGTLNVK